MFGFILEDYDMTRQDNVKIVKVNAETASFFDVMSLPTTILFKEGTPVEKNRLYA